MTHGSIMAYLVSAPCMAIALFCLTLLPVMVIDHRIPSWNLQAKFDKNKLRILLGCFILAEIVFGALHLGAYINHRLATKKQMQNVAIKSEEKACQNVGYSKPRWVQTLPDAGLNRVYLFICADKEGFLHQITAPKCNRQTVKNCK